MQSKRAPQSQTPEVSNEVEMMMEKMKLSMEDLISTDEASRRMGISSRQVWHLIQQSKLVGKRIGRAWIVYAPSIEGFTKSSKGRPVARKKERRKTAS